MKLKAAIIDNEQHAIETLAYDLQQCHSQILEIIFTESDPVAGLKRVRREIPDILFLDINMPAMSGMDLIELIADLPTRVVFTTAHAHYAPEAVETNAAAYLVKPVTLDDLNRVVTKIHEQFNNQRSFQDKIQIPDSQGITLVSHAEILYCRARDNYCEFLLVDNKRLLSSKHLGAYEAILPQKDFMRVHKSFIINFSQVKRVERSQNLELIMVNGDPVPVSRSRRNEVLQRFQG